MALTYAAVTDLETYLDRDLDDAAATRVLEKAERDVDGILYQRGSRIDATGLLYDPSTLASHDAAALMRATCAQAEYRMAKGEDFFIHAQRARESGPDFTVEGRLPYIGPKVYRELGRTGLTRGRLQSIPMVGTFGRRACDEDDLPWPAA